jgi:hypothetical protein
MLTAPFITCFMQDEAGSSDEFADFGFVDMTKLKTRLYAMFGGSSTRADEEDDAPPSTAAGAAADERVSHRDAVTPELMAHLQKLAGSEDATK